LEAFRFARFVLGVPVPDQLMSDPQLRDRALRLMAEKETYKPARPLKGFRTGVAGEDLTGAVGPY